MSFTRSFLGTPNARPTQQFNSPRVVVPNRNTLNRVPFVPPPQVMHPSNVLHYGITSQNMKEFRQTILRFLKTIDDREVFLEILNEDNVKQYLIPAFTSHEVNENACYEWLELIGDGLIHSFMSVYFSRRFPFLCCAEGVKVIARLKINYGSKKTLSAFAEKCGFFPFISASEKDRNEKKNHLLEDVFEALIGAIQLIVDKKFGLGAGYATCYKVLQTIYDGLNIDLENLYDNVTMLKELFDLEPIHTEHGRFAYVEYHNEERTSYKCVVKFKNQNIATSVATSESEARQTASGIALAYLKANGIYKYKSPFYQKIAMIQSGAIKGNVIPSDKITSEEEIKKMFVGVEIPEGTNYIDVPIVVREESKVFNKQVSTVLALCCKRRDLGGVKLCLQLKANANILDNNGLSCVDLLLTHGACYPSEENERELVIVKEILKQLCKATPQTKIDNEYVPSLIISKIVYEMFYKEYCKHIEIGIKFRKMFPFLKIV